MRQGHLRPRRFNNGISALVPRLFQQPRDFAPTEKAANPGIYTASNIAANAAATAAGGAGFELAGVASPIARDVILSGLQSGINSAADQDWSRPWEAIGKTALDTTLGAAGGAATGWVMRALPKAIADEWYGADNVPKNLKWPETMDELDDLANGRLNGYTEGTGEAFDPDNVLTLSTRFVNKMDPMWKNSESIKPIDGFQDIVCHGDTTGFSYKDLDGNEINLTPREFAEILKNSPVYEGRPIRLISCQTGADGSLTAQYVANHLGVDVLAPTDTVFVYPDGEIIIGPDKYHNTGTWKIFKPRR